MKASPGGVPLHSLATRVLCTLLALLLSGAASPAFASTPTGLAKDSVGIPFLIVAPGTSAEQVVWFAPDEGPLARGERLQQEEVRALLATVATHARHPALASVARKLQGGQQLEAWEWRLWRDYLAYVGRAGVATNAPREDMRPTAEDRRDMALRVALEALLPGMAEQLGEDLSLQNAAFSVLAAITGYLLMWALPEPITKLAALGVTLVMLAAFGARLLVHVVNEWKLLTQATQRARTFEAVKEAGLRFGRELGADGARLLFVLASLALGHTASPLLKKLPPPPRPGATWMAELPGGVRVPITEVKSITPAQDTFIVTMAAGAGVTSSGSSASPNSSTPGGASSEKLAANMQAAGVSRPAGTAAHHIVAGNASAAEPARAVLRRFGVDINEAANGVFLPANRMTPSSAQGAVHSTIHTEAYYEAVNRVLAQATSKQDVLRILAFIRQALVSGGFP